MNKKVVIILVLMSVIGVSVFEMWGKQTGVVKGGIVVASSTATSTTIKALSVKSSQKTVTQSKANATLSVTLVGGATYSDPKEGFTIVTPSDWLTDTTGKFGTKVLFYNPKADKTASSTFTANVNVLTEPVDELTSLTYMEMSKKGLKEVYPDYTVLREGMLMVSGHEGRVIEATFTQGVFPVHNVQLVVVFNKKATVVTGTSLASAWEKNVEAIEKAVRSVGVK
jgi:hypothetical protein